MSQNIMTRIVVEHLRVVVSALAWSIMKNLDLFKYTKFQNI